MATVYLADDLKHERKVALKVLKPELAAVVGAERFLSEIKTTANLNHPHILPLHDSGEADSFLFYVMPHVEGESLRDRLDREKQLPVDEAVRIATAVASALDHAHRHGVIHRDIKPANILLQDGEPVVADFGIALAVGAAGGDRLTETGLSLGTPHYMSPEQATGDQTVSPATDTYALGCVLYETLVGEPPYTGSTAQAILGRIIMGEPVSATKTRSSVPANVDAAIRKALEKLPADRFTVPHDFAKALADPGFRHGGLVGAGAAVGAGHWNRLSLTFASLFVLAAGVAAWSLLRPGPPAPLARFSSPFEEGQLPNGGMEFSAGGSALVYRGPGASGQRTQLWIRQWADFDATPIPGTGGASTFALSPDEQEVAMVVDIGGPLTVVALDGGPSRALAERAVFVWDWVPDGTVYFTGGNPSNIQRASATDGGSEAVEAVTELLEGEAMHGTFQALPGGKMGVFQVWYSLTGEDAEVWAIDLDTGERSFLTEGNTPRYASTGHLLFGTPDGALMAAPIDPGTAELSGSPVPVAEGLAINDVLGVVLFSVSESGTLLYLEGDATTSLAELVWVTRSGEAVPVDPGWLFDPPQMNYGWRLSPDGTRVALTMEVDGNEDIWIKQLPDGPFERLTFDDSIERYAVWTPDGQSVTYVRQEPAGNFDVWRRRADGTGAPELLFDDDRGLAQGRWSADGGWMVFRTDVIRPEAEGGQDIVGFRPGVDSVTVPLVATAEFAEQGAAPSPDGRWLAYSSNETGRLEVYVSPFPDVESDKVQVSSDGGRDPLWANSGSELFYLDFERRLIAVRVATTPSFTVLQSQTLFTNPPRIMSQRITDFYDIARDDQRFLMGRLAAGASPDVFGVVLVQNFFEELIEKVGR